MIVGVIASRDPRTRAGGGGRTRASGDPVADPDYRTRRALPRPPDRARHRDRAETRAPCCRSPSAAGILQLAERSDRDRSRRRHAGIRRRAHSLLKDYFPTGSTPAGLCPALCSLALIEDDHSEEDGYGVRAATQLPFADVPPVLPDVHVTPTVDLPAIAGLDVRASGFTPGSPSPSDFCTRTPGRRARPSRREPDGRRRRAHRHHGDCVPPRRVLGLRRDPDVHARVPRLPTGRQRDRASRLRPGRPGEPTDGDARP